MPYPNSPFVHDIDLGIEAGKKTQLTSWLCSPPYVSSYRVNTLLHSVADVFEMVKDEVTSLSERLKCKIPKVYIHDTLTDVIIVENINSDDLDLLPKSAEVMIDTACGAAVLRGAHVFAPGVLGMTADANLCDDVSIYVDINKVCKKGCKQFNELSNKFFVGNGVVRMRRAQLFGDNLDPRGIGVELKYAVSGCLPLGDLFLPQGAALLQNIPSVVCVEVLNPQAGEKILDMCASPGNKTTNIAAKMKNKGSLIAIDKTAKKVNQLKETCDKFGAIVTIYEANSANILELNPQNQKIAFAPNSFDKILLDAPCSCLGRRPQLRNADTQRMIYSFIPLQRKLLDSAVQLLKVGGVLVYSTCTITLAENEGMIGWVLNTYDCLKLVKAKPHLGGTGLPVETLRKEQLGLLQRFDHEGEVDSVGFFIAKLVKSK